MNVYAIKAYGNYGGGMAIVAAESDVDAIAIADTIEARGWHVRYGQPESVEWLPCPCAGPARVLTHYEIGE